MENKRTKKSEVSPRLNAGQLLDLDLDQQQVALTQVGRASRWLTCCCGSVIPFTVGGGDHSRQQEAPATDHGPTSVTSAEPCWSDTDGVFVICSQSEGLNFVVLVVGACKSKRSFTKILLLLLRLLFQFLFPHLLFPLFLLLFLFLVVEAFSTAKSSFLWASDQRVLHLHPVIPSFTALFEPGVFWHAALLLLFAGRLPTVSSSESEFALFSPRPTTTSVVLTGTIALFVVTSC